MLLKIERKRMSSTATANNPEPLTLEKVYRELLVLRERVEDIEDLHDLEEAIAENAGKPLIPWDEAKKDLDLD
jgi:DNA-directed RNA polymerase sigma subunit (sigma70/sigma32)